MLDNMGCLERVRPFLSVTLFVDLFYGLGDAKSFGMERRLGNKTVREGKAKYAGNASGETE